MAQPTTKTIKQLFAVSGNQCAFPGCTVPLVDSASGTVLGEICHIKAQSPDGPRYDPSQDEKARHGFKNLLLLCPTHHKIIDDNPDTYPIERLQKIKTRHEAQHTERAEASDDVIHQLILKVEIEGNVTGRQVAIGDHITQIGEVHVHSEPTLTPLHQLPPPPGDFTGREDELATLTAAVETGGAVICGLRGMGGVGKTVLALKLAQQLIPRYPDAQFYLNLQGTNPQPLTPAEAMAHIIRSYHPTAQLPESEAKLSAVYRSVLYEQRAILLMDNAANRAQVEPLLPPSSCLFLVTSRQHFTLPDLRSLNLDKLLPVDARALLLKIAHRLGDNGSYDCADEIAKLCGYLPLALRLAGSALAERIDIDPADYLEQLRDAQTRLSLIDASLSLSYNLLDTKLQRLWCLLSVFPATFDRAAVSSVWEMNDTPTQDALSNLTSYSLIRWNPGTSRYSLHDLTRLFVQARLEAADRNQAQQRHATYYEAVLRAANELYEQGGESIGHGLALFDLEWPNIQAGQAWAAEHLQKDDGAAHLCSYYPDAGADCLSLRLHSRERIRWLETALNAAQKLGNRAAEGAHLSNLGMPYSTLGQKKKAIRCYEQALAIVREIGDRKGEETALGNLGGTYRTLGQVEKAIEYHQQALAITCEIGDRRGEGVHLGNLGLAYLDLGQVEKAIEYLQQALVIAREVGNRGAEGVHLGNLGIAYLTLGQDKKAVKCYEQVLTISRRIGDRIMMGGVLSNLGNVYRALGRVKRAIEYHQQALPIFREVGDRRGEGSALGNLGMAYLDLGQVETAIEYHRRALIIAREIGDRRNEANWLGSLGLAYCALGQEEKAHELWEQALHIFEGIKNPGAEYIRSLLASLDEEDDTILRSLLRRLDILKR